MPGDSRMPLILWLKPEEYGDLISALGADDHFHEILRRVVLAHTDQAGGVALTLTQADAAQIISDLDISEFDLLGDVVEQMREQLTALARNTRIVSQRFALPIVGTFFGD